MRTLLLVVLLCGALSAAHSQADSLSRWAVGIEGNIVINAYCESPCFNSNRGNLLPIGLETEYRALRWLSFPARLDFWSLKSSGILTSNEGYSFGIYKTNFRMKAAMISAGPRFMFRLGQGDLGLSYRAGLAIQNSRQELRHPNRPDLQMKFKSVVSAFHNLELGYAYWVQPRLAIRFSVQASQPYNYPEKLEVKASSSELSSFQEVLYQLVAEEPIFFSFHYSAVAFAILYRL